MTTLEIILGALVPLTGGGGALAVWLRSRGATQRAQAQSDGRAAVAREQGAAAVVPQIMARLDAVEAKHADCERRNDECEERGRAHARQIVTLGERLSAVERERDEITQRIELAAEKVVRRTTGDTPIPAAPLPRETQTRPPAGGEET